MQGMLVLMALLVLVGGYQGARSTGDLSVDTVIETSTARQMLQTANTLGRLKALGGNVLSLCPGNRPSNLLSIPGLEDNPDIYCTEYNGRVFVWAKEKPGMARVLRELSRDSRLLARINEGRVNTLVDPAPWPVPLPAGITEGSLVYIN
ncbi:MULTISPECIES: type IV pilus biogenesis protein PilM [Pectobacterium]|uniref:Pilus assembly protein n=3 Tax=Pectobacterium TaxID=122277 RepID=A0AA93AJA2_9GAMM|nr:MULTISPECIES: type IV pilus biogenesis protein PilM [Pectobacterium]AZK61315.1 pilus assembly protein [Pectobacterium versatile]MBA5206048.1 type IV pilus biogenesis protein PilM [Pectobacterium aroidearum]MBN3180241.1 type IV pilus biogenesis protein PilM [Pectobacterium parmentieri]MBQ4791683.1 type IV pilus biogenesis protein PilM [Pectobacterium versatile]MCH5049190.1 type IV pilus biogenesis protein PilM [Pectobacterium aquaticum]